ncbi:MAG TPA: 5-dehydro-4-deoxy-D-glucuronate isomerase [Chitinophagaceae bacterium]|nr:5-dehydro-4-deoxy-D-glucuronate isomerase [Chitinophagaceae bacterium]
MEIRFQHSAAETSRMNTDELRTAFLAENLMTDDVIKLYYTHYDRVIAGGAKPVNKKLILETHPELRAAYFLERREMGIINVGGKGTIHADDSSFVLDTLDCLYIGKGVQRVSFESADAKHPSHFYLLSAPAHQLYPVQLVTSKDAMPTDIGSKETANERTIYKYIHDKGARSCQLVMGLTILKSGSVWNTMPAHTHTRRMEAYYYFNLQEDHRIFHFMGEPQQTRHIAVANHQAVFSPPWSVHAGCGTGNYSFIWGMAGENYTYTDMDVVEIKDLR